MSFKRLNKIPIKGKRNIMITSALPYCNSTPHLGNLIGCVLSADVFNRFSTLRGYNSLYICGTDEYGTATEFKALEENCSPKEICDKYFKIHKQIYDWFEIKFDYFGRTGTPQQTKITTDIFLKLEKNGFISERTINQHFCNKCKKYLADRFITGDCPVCNLSGARGDQCDSCGEIYETSALQNPRCKRCSSETTVRDTKHLFLRLTAMKEKITEWIEKKVAEGGWSQNTINVSRAWIKKIEDRCITRSLKWGTPVPKKGYEDKVFYVWFDAPIGYLSITDVAVENWEKWWKNEDVEQVEFMGKDNIAFHTIVFPSTLIGTGDNYKLVDKISTTEYLMYDGGKFSKSKSIGVFGDDAMNTGIPPCIWRFYLLSTRPETSDSDFKWEEFQLKANSELNNNFGNFVQRTISFIHSKMNGTVPDLDHLVHHESKFANEIKLLYKEYLEQMEKIRLNSSIRIVMKISNKANSFFQTSKPWETHKSTEATLQASCKNTLNICFQIVRLLAALVSPFMPSISNKIADQINSDIYNLQNEDFEITKKFSGHKINTPEILFKKIDNKTIENLKQKFSGKNTLVFPLDLIVGTVLQIQDHPNAENLWIFKIKIKKYTTTVVSSLKKYYSVEDILLKKVVLVNNVKKVKFFGVSSQAMILCAKKGENFEIIFAENCNEGDRIKPEGNSSLVEVAKKFNYKKNWASLNLKSDSNGNCLFSGIKLVAGNSELKVSPECDLV